MEEIRLHQAKPITAWFDRALCCHAWFPILVLGSITFLAYFPTLWNGFCLDDTSILTAPYPRTFTDSIYLFVEPVPHGLALLYRPLTFLTFILDLQLWGENAWGFHLTNIVLAMLAVVVAYFLTAHWLPAPYALLAASLFAVHTGHSEAVIGIFNRGQLLGGLGMLLALLCFVKTLPPYPPRRRWMYLAALATLVGCFAKENALVTPIICLLLICLYRPARAWWLHLVSGITLQVSVVLLYLIFRYTALQMLAMPGVDGFVDGQGWWTIYVQFSLTLTTYLRYTFFPFFLSCDYPWPIFFSHWSVVVPPLFLVAAAYLLCQSEYVERLAGFCCLWFVGCLLPVLHLVPLQIAFAERFLFPATLGMMSLLALVWWKLRGHKFFTALVLIIPLLVMTMYRCGDWRDNATLWRRTLKTTPESYRALIYLAAEANRENHTSLAFQYYQAALKARPNRHNEILINYNLGMLLLEARQPKQALHFFSEALQRHPEHNPSWIALGDASARQKNWQGAIYFYQQVKVPLNRWDKDYEAVQKKLTRCQVRNRLGD